mmetsp:Transcript_15200/g.27129  ORF Transcript_15200/g.27129 Transcript_15200/m.27129 type:complete len:121 (+) Transcript_15200:1895-2257(+)
MHFSRLSSHTSSRWPPTHRPQGMVTKDVEEVCLNLDIMGPHLVQPSQGKAVKSAPLLTANTRFWAGVPMKASTKCVPSPENSCSTLDIDLSSSTPTIPSNSSPDNDVVLTSASAYDDDDV